MSSESNHSALVTSWGSSPTYTSTPTPPPPGANETQIRLLAAGVHRVVRSRASGQHYSASILPHTVGTDGTGLTVPDNKPVYFSAMGPAGGSMAEVLNVPTTSVVPLPEGADAVQVAAMANPAMSSWMALKTRTDGLPKDFSVVVLGVTSASGRLGVSVAKTFGAGRVVGVARNEGAMKAIGGLDEGVVLKEKAEETDWAKVGEVDVVLDYLYGAPAKACLEGLPKGKRVQYVQIGSLAGEEMPLPSAVLRGKNITMRGAGPGAWSFQELGKEMGRIVGAAAGIEKQKLRVEKLKDVDTVWQEKSGSERLVFVP
ncbi:uncharacterized protein KY384_000565 [Bacidia gigantensis]|uniref:uncharacterized protein n=1 Tax=Bacidia gigantensis TaxID=2732470 RepID=UPI001D047670|nr:uncharacterized protein KY384_000565 [Bacidia gigantensis]KAG8525805.1 hypothetical protein KY384_000565 [Bacidia gigantensis]